MTQRQPRGKIEFGKASCLALCIKEILYVLKRLHAVRIQIELRALLTIGLLATEESIRGYFLHASVLLQRLKRQKYWMLVRSILIPVLSTGSRYFSDWESAKLATGIARLVQLALNHEEVTIP